jgi:hypothetical protein
VVQERSISVPKCHHRRGSFLVSQQLLPTHGSKRYITSLPTTSPTNLHSRLEKHPISISEQKSRQIPHSRPPIFRASSALVHLTGTPPSVSFYPTLLRKRVAVQHPSGVAFRTALPIPTLSEQPFSTSKISKTEIFKICLTLSKDAMC